jgi:nucleoside-diphosphate-sugar epimerase
MQEVRYLWRTPVRMSNAGLVAALGYEPHTPLDDAVLATLKGMGNLGNQARREA